MEELEIATPTGPACVHLRRAADARGALVLGHGAGGGVSAPDLSAAADVAFEEGLAVALVEQPYRVAGRRSPPPVQKLDEAWEAVVADLFADVLRGLSLVAGGRSLGARVACRTASATGAAGVLCLAFPLVPPGRSGAGKSRLPELEAVTVPTLVVQGERDPFGMPPSGGRRTVARVAGDHSLRSDPQAVGEAVRAWLPDVLGRAPASR